MASGFLWGLSYGQRHWPPKSVGCDSPKRLNAAAREKNRLIAIAVWYITGAWAAMPISKKENRIALAILFSFLLIGAQEIGKGR